MGNSGVHTTAGHEGIFFVYGEALKERRGNGICMIFFSLSSILFHTSEFTFDTVGTNSP
jgi:hypothetical protein